MRDATRLARKGILGLKPYVPGKPIEEVQRELGLKEIVKLASNENPNGPSPEAIRAIKAELESIYQCTGGHDYGGKRVRQHHLYDRGGIRK